MSWLLVTFFALAVANGLIIPSFESMDEPEHFNYMRYLADGHGLPDQRDIATARAYNYYQEGGQPPLYYALGALVLQFVSEDVSDVEALTAPNPLSTCGDLSQPYSKGLYMRNPLREAWPYRGAALGVHLLRLFSAVLGVVTVSGVYLAARSAFPTVRNVGLVAAALVAFNPRFIVHSAAVTNDTLLAALSAWAIYLAVDTLRRGPSWPRSLALGTVIGLAAMTKVSGIFLLPLAGLALLDWAWREKAWARTFRHLVLIGLLSLMIGGWWYVGNMARYGGDPGLVPLVTQQTGLRTEWPVRLIIPEIRKFLHSYWTSANYCELRFGYFPLYGALSAVGIAGLVVGFLKASATARRGAALLLVWIAVVFAAWFRFNSMVFAPNGRYLFQAHAAIAPLLAAGLLALIGHWPAVWRGLVVGLGIAALATPVAILAPLFNPPPAYATDRVVAPNPLEATFGDQVRLLGYDVSAETARAGETIDVTLYLAADKPITESLALGLQLKSAGPRDDTVLVNFRNWPGGGNLPTTAWQPGEAFADRYRLHLPPDVSELQMWELRLMFFEYPRQEGSDDRVPVRVGDVEGGPYAVLGYLRVEPLKLAAVPEAAELHPPPGFGEGHEVTLEAAHVAPSDDGTGLRVTLWWRSHAPLGGDYTVFVHLQDADDTLWATGDDLPRGGAMPTSRWRSGDLIVDKHHVLLPEGLPAGQYHVSVGFYDAGGRLPAWDGNGRPRPEGSVVIGEWDHGGE